MKKYHKYPKNGLFALLILVSLAVLPGTVLARWPEGSQGDQYGHCNKRCLDRVAMDVGVPPASFIEYYNDAITGLRNYQMPTGFPTVSSCPSGLL